VLSYIITPFIGIEKYLIGRKKFDCNNFYADVKQLFADNGLLKQNVKVLT